MDLHFKAEGLSAYTPYRFRVRAVTFEHGASPWSDASDIIRTKFRQQRWLESVPTSSEGVLLKKGKGSIAPNSGDLDFFVGAALGGSMGGDGGDGVIVVSAFIYNQPDTPQSIFFNTGAPQYYSVPTSPVPGTEIAFVEVKAWGAGGGGGCRSEHGHGGAGGLRRQKSMQRRVRFSGSWWVAWAARRAAVARVASTAAGAAAAASLGAAAAAAPLRYGGRAMAPSSLRPAEAAVGAARTTAARTAVRVAATLAIPASLPWRPRGTTLVVFLEKNSASESSEIRATRRGFRPTTSTVTQDLRQMPTFASWRLRGAGGRLTAWSRGRRAPLARGRTA